MQATIKVENVEIKKSNFGPYKVITAEDGTRFNLGSKNENLEMAIGGMYAIEYSLNDKGYKRIDRILDPGSPQAKQAVAMPKPSREQSIEMQVCLKCATEAVVGLRSSGEYKPADITKDITAIAKDLYINIFTTNEPPF